MESNFSDTSAAVIGSEDMPTFSVIIPVYNRAHIIASTLDSLTNQTFQDFECIIIDDGSKDSSALEAIVAQYSHEKFRYYHYPNGGAATARNRGIEQARGQYIAFLDSDDRFLPNKLERVHEEMMRNPADLYFAFAEFRRTKEVGTTRPSRQPRPGEMLEDFLFCALEPIQTTTIIANAAHCKARPFVNGLKKYEEAIFIVNLIQNGSRWHFIPETLTVWNDEEVENRLGSRREAENMSQWYRENGNMLSPSARAGFRSNVLSYEYGWKNPAKVIFFIVDAFIAGHVSAKRSVQSLLRALLPQPIYRLIVNGMLRHGRR